MSDQASAKFDHPTIDFSDLEKAVIVMLHAWASSEIGNRLRVMGKPVPDAETRREISDRLQDAIAAVVLSLRDRKGVPPSTEWLELIGGLVEGALFRFCESPEERRGRLQQVN